MRLILPVPPSWNASYRSGKGRFYTPASIFTFRNQVMVAGRNAHIRKFPRETEVVVHIWWYRKLQAGDLDKRASVLLDALQDVWYVNDQQVGESHYYRFEDKANPRIEVEVLPRCQEKAA